MKVKASCQQKGFERGLTCQELPDRESVFSMEIKEEGSFLCGHRLMGTRVPSPCPVEHVFGKDVPYYSKTVVGFMLCDYVHLIF